MEKILWIFAFMLLFSVGFRPVPQRVVTGRVTFADDGSGLPAVNVLLKGTSIATVTDAYGKYSIAVPEKGGKLIFALVGMASQEISIGTKSIIDVQLSYDKLSIQEVVVTGYSTAEPEYTPATQRDRKVKYEEHKVAYDKAYSNPQGDQQPDYNTEEYDAVRDNTFQNARTSPLSTFSIDVDVASYSNVRRFINAGQQPPKDAVRVEEMINYFNYNYTQPKGDDPFSITTEISAAPWNSKHKLVQIGLQGKRIATDKLPPSNLVFLIDVSGSMNDQNKLTLLKSSFKMLVEELRPQDHVAIVVYAGAAGLVLEPTSGDNKKKITEALDNLQAGGSTAGGAGINLAYAIAKEHFKKGGNNRIILATDGDFNVGESSNASMERLVEDKRQEGVFLTVLGFGMGNYKDSKMEILADKGNGNYAYIDNITEARKVLVNEFGGTLFTIAKDVKLQLEFNPAKIQAYRLIGYENRMLKSEDFNNDKKDAGELGSGHTVTALYEIIPVDVEPEFFTVDKLKYQSTKETLAAMGTNELMTVKFRYKKPDGDVSKLIEQSLMDTAMPVEEASENFRWAASVAAFGMMLRESEYVKNYTYDQLIQQAQKGRGDDEEGYRAEFINLVKSACAVARK